jgi:hypothetical protein
MRICIALLLTAGTFLAAQSQAPGAQSLNVRPEVQARNLALLAAAEKETEALPPLLRIYALARIADGYQRLDREKAKEKNAALFQLTKGIEDQRQRISYQSAVLRRLNIASDPVIEALWLQAEPEARMQTHFPIVLKKLREHDYKGALKIVDGLDLAKSFPYDTVSRLLSELPPEMEADRQRLFLAARDSARDPNLVQARVNDFGTLLLQSWKSVPPAMALDGVNTLLEQASPAERQSSLIFSTDQKPIAFSSLYEYRVFQMLPLLRELDPVKAEQVAQSAPKSEALAQEFPDGIRWPGSPQKQSSDVPEAKRPTISSMRSGSPSPNLAKDIESAKTSGEMMARVTEVRRLAGQDPEAALAQALALPEVSEGRSRSQYRLMAVESVAISAMRKSPSTAQAALDEMVRIIPQLTLDQRAAKLDFVISFSYRLKDQARLASAIELATKTADDLYKDDIDTDDPNLAIKAVWPSSSLWQSIAFYQAKQSPGSTVSIADHIMDPDIRVLVKVAAALGMVQEGSFQPSFEVHKKSYSSANGPPLF